MAPMEAQVARQPARLEPEPSGFKLQMKKVLKSMSKSWHAAPVRIMDSVLTVLGCKYDQSDPKGLDRKQGFISQAPSPQSN